MMSVKPLIDAFGEEQVCRLTGLSQSQLRYWTRTEFFEPSVRNGSPAERVYSFTDIIALKTLALLRKDHDVPLQHLRRVRSALGSLDQHMWAKEQIFVFDRRVVIMPDSAFQDALSGQVLLGFIALEPVLEETQSGVRSMMVRHDADHGAITKINGVARGKQIFSGTRIPVSAVSDFISANYSNEEILKQYPTLTTADIEAARILCTAKSA